jgi:hypothetical protein
VLDAVAVMRTILLLSKTSPLLSARHALTAVLLAARPKRLPGAFHVEAGIGKMMNWDVLVSKHSFDQFSSFRHQRMRSHPKSMQ